MRLGVSVVGNSKMRRTKHAGKMRRRHDVLSAGPNVLRVRRRSAGLLRRWKPIELSGIDCVLSARLPRPRWKLVVRLDTTSDARIATIITTWKMMCGMKRRSAAAEERLVTQLVRPRLPRRSGIQGAV
jgi:hypothetical protein